MALRVTGYWRTLLTRMAGNRSMATSTAQKMKPMTGRSETVDSHRPKHKALKGEYAPIAIVLGMCGVAVAMAMHSAKQQLLHHPGVTISKKRRESLMEADNPDKALKEANKFLTKSFLRRVAHIQDSNEPVVPDSIHGDVFASEKKAVTLKSVGVQ
ncbi:hypothetical protein H6P81_013445 [Aristolochia fimbriata]|uniref:Uncharacterized protein n=1 Tax=Aristolochia fimbriata TaxID=158543 RepID=A0AAV7EI00_ARIFI|nr:hypothetical protein H6P81_013445 [Aristolochia fimbriata]